MELKPTPRQTDSAASQSRLQAIWSRAKRNPRWMVMEALSRFVSVRNTVKILQKKPRLDQYNLAETEFDGVNASEFVAALNRDGFCEGLHLRRATIEQILKFAAQATCYGHADPRCGFRYSEKPAAQQFIKKVFSQGTYLFLDDLQPLIDRLANDPLLLAVTAEYIQAPPVNTGGRLWWLFATPEADYNPSVTTSFFHYDKDDYAALRFFFFLTDVDASAGPHVVVRGSHSRKKMSQLISLGERSDREISDQYGQRNLITIYGTQGAGFAEDPFCFHKACRPVHCDRLMLEIKYAVRDYKIFPLPDRSMTANITPMPPAPGPVI